uniref:Uncharacterized protein n=1 Tax=Nephroselmis olivacea TaxID=31312 RepID=Q9T381_NEPOL|nr:hypothetical protein NeolCp097 [Nephroselmis olivacea]NP_050945.1 hypothetical protein NeolCp140 [Nephroselmis olivacea]AAD54873.1 unknown [Nephroselmis olivacea]AAD54916.1 unknown [Nephroselmis olivacea]
MQTRAASLDARDPRAEWMFRVPTEARSTAPVLQSTRWGALSQMTAQPSRKQSLANERKKAYQATIRHLLVQLSLISSSTSMIASTILYQLRPFFSLLICQSKSPWVNILTKTRVTNLQVPKNVRRSKDVSLMTMSI